MQGRTFHKIAVYVLAVIITVQPLGFYAPTVHAADTVCKQVRTTSDASAFTISDDYNCWEFTDASTLTESDDRQVKVDTSRTDWDLVVSGGGHTIDNTWRGAKTGFVDGMALIAGSVGVPAGVEAVGSGAGAAIEDAGKVYGGSWSLAGKALRWIGDETGSETFQSIGRKAEQLGHAGRQAIQEAADDVRLETQATARGLRNYDSFFYEAFSKVLKATWWATQNADQVADISNDPKELNEFWHQHGLGEYSDTQKRYIAGVVMPVVRSVIYGVGIASVVGFAVGTAAGGTAVALAMLLAAGVTFGPMLIDWLRNQDVSGDALLAKAVKRFGINPAQALSSHGVADTLAVGAPASVSTGLAALIRGASKYGMSAYQGGLTSLAGYPGAQVGGLVGLMSAKMQDTWLKINAIPIKSEEPPEQDWFYNTEDEPGAIHNNLMIILTD